MTCDERDMLVGAYVDGELDAGGALDVERHVAGCRGCARYLQELRALRTNLRRGAPAYEMPDNLRTNVRAAVRSAQLAPAAPAPVRAVARAPWWVWGSRAGAMAATVVLLAAVVPRVWHAAGGGAQVQSQSPSSLIADQVVSSHIRSLMPGHLFDVASTDQHTVKPWFDGRIDYAPPVNDLRSQGFPLVGGRLDYVDDRPVAALVYGRFKHTINLFVWPAGPPEPADSPLRSTSRRGYHVDSWNGSGLTFWAVSDVNPTDLQAFCRLVQHDAAPATRPEAPPHPPNVQVRNSPASVPQ